MSFSIVMAYYLLPVSRFERCSQSAHFHGVERNVRILYRLEHGRVLMRSPYFSIPAVPSVPTSVLATSIQEEVITNAAFHARFMPKNLSVPNLPSISIAGSDGLKSSIVPSSSNVSTGLIRVQVFIMCAFRISYLRALINNSTTTVVLMCALQGSICRSKRSPYID